MATENAVKKPRGRKPQTVETVRKEYYKVQNLLGLEDCHIKTSPVKDKDGKVRKDLAATVEIMKLDADGNFDTIISASGNTFVDMCRATLAFAWEQTRLLRAVATEKPEAAVEVESEETSAQ